jgi:hypothetical protein
MSVGWVNISPEQCLKQETLFLIRTTKCESWQGRHGEKLGSVIKIDLRPYGRANNTYGYDGDNYREATGLDKIFVISGQCDVIIERHK